jgi:hypothetical protein
MPNLIVEPGLTAVGSCHAPNPFTLSWGVTNGSDSDDEFECNLIVHDDRAGSEHLLVTTNGTIAAGATSPCSFTYSPDAPGHVIFTVTITGGGTDSVEVICTGDPDIPIA